MKLNIIKMTKRLYKELSFNSLGIGYKLYVQLGLLKNKCRPTLGLPRINAINRVNIKQLNN